MSKSIITREIVLIGGGTAGYRKGRWKPIAAALFLVAAGFGISACVSSPSTTTPSTTSVVSQDATDVNLIATGIAAAVTEVSAIPGVDQTKVTALQGYLVTIQADAKTIAAATATPSTSTLQEIEQAVNAAAPILLALIPGGSAATGIVEAATSLLPTVLADFGVSGVTVANQAPKYTAVEARAILSKAH